MGREPLVPYDRDLTPRHDRFQAIAQAGSRAPDVFGIPGRHGRDVTINLIQRRLLPFWSVSCKSRVHYDRISRYTIQASDSDVVEIAIGGVDGNQLVYPVNQQSKDRLVTLNGVERCITQRSESSLIRSYEMPTASSIMARARRRLLGEQGQTLVDYLSNPLRQVADLAQFFQSKSLEGSIFFRDLTEGEEIQIVLPNKDVNSEVSEVIEKVIVPIKPRVIHESTLKVEQADLYYHPTYVFEFRRPDGSGRSFVSKLEQIDALTGDWFDVPSREVKQPDIPWDKILLLALDTSSEILLTFGPPGLKIPAIFVKSGLKYLGRSKDD
jgi:hypothetical protein